MKRFILPRKRLPISGGHFALLDAALAADDYLGARLLLQGLERVAARPDDQADEVDLGMAVLRDQDLVRDSNLDRPKK